MKFLPLSALVVLMVTPFLLHAQVQSLSVTPPLFQISVNPGDVWQSSVRVVNPNNFPLTVYAEVVNFAPDGEAGQGSFTPILNTEATPITLAEWIDISEGPYTIPSGRSTEISFIVDIPHDAPPGGHFAAILISTEPPSVQDGPVVLATTQTVTSLFFVRIEGDIIEKADIREFSVLDRSIELPEAEFSLRFENKGNVHIQPRGSIRITNMWGKERGVIPINHDSHFGNVLPESIRDFRFSWKGERSLADIGRYQAEVSLTYGESGSQSAVGITHFWVLPIRGALITVGVLISIIAIITWMIRLYIRHMLALAGITPDTSPQVSTAVPKDHTSMRSRAFLPLRDGARELRKRFSDVHKLADIFITLFGFVLHYRRFFAALAFLIVLFIGAVIYIERVMTEDTSYEVGIKRGDRIDTYTDTDLKTP